MDTFGQVASVSSPYGSMTRREAIKALWLEFRVAASYVPTWDRAVENVELIRRKELRGDLPTQDDLAGLAPAISRGGSAVYWMQQVDPMAWFLRDELGLGSGVNVFNTLATLTEDNTRRRKSYVDRLERLKRDAKVISRRVHNGERRRDAK